MRCLNVQVDTAISLKRGSGGISCLVGFTISTRFFFFLMALVQEWLVVDIGLRPVAVHSRSTSQYRPIRLSKQSYMPATLIILAVCPVVCIRKGRSDVILNERRSIQLKCTNHTLDSDCASLRPPPPSPHHHMH